VGVEGMWGVFYPEYSEKQLWSRTSTFEISTT